MSVRAVVMFSGGLGSWAAARLWVDEHGPDGLVLLFTDTNGEDPDLYRFLRDAAADVGAPLVMLDNDGRTVWDVFRGERMIGNSRLALCSRDLKQRPARAWVDEHAPSAEIILGIDWTEEHRAGAVHAGWAPHRVTLPLMAARVDPRRMAAERGLGLPRLYRQGFAHNNCGGACVRAGQAQWALLLETNPARFADEERNEAEMRAELGKNVAILRERVRGEIRPLPLSELRDRFERQPAMIDRGDVGGCGCFA